MENEATLRCMRRQSLSSPYAHSVVGRASSHPDAIGCPTPGFPHGKCQGWAGGTGGGGHSVPMRWGSAGLRVLPVDP